MYNSCNSINSILARYSDVEFVEYVLNNLESDA